MMFMVNPLNILFVPAVIILHAKNNFVVTLKFQHNMKNVGLEVFDPRIKNEFHNMSIKLKPRMLILTVGGIAPLYNDKKFFSNPSYKKILSSCIFKCPRGIVVTKNSSSVPNYLTCMNEVRWMLFSIKIRI